jgi:hypothetical protein
MRLHLEFGAERQSPAGPQAGSWEFTLTTKSPTGCGFCHSPIPVCRVTAPAIALTGIPEGYNASAANLGEPTVNASPAG